MSIEISGVGDGESTTGIVRGWKRPQLVPMSEVLNRNQWSQIRTAVYVVCTAEAEVLYVGSVRRSQAALAPRMRKHFSEDPGRGSTWTHLAVVILPDALGLQAVRRCEGRAGRALDPLDNQQLPAVPERGPWIPRQRQAQL
ncbi:hypothetical protein AB0H86_06250 [Streptomyces sp. NPDC050997]|uniref:hypothetical protein n=1 Tax=Streptomyces sp. NPDC050997 TaxID=3155519 RepID=UPI0034204A4F